MSASSFRQRRHRLTSARAVVGAIVLLALAVTLTALQVYDDVVGRIRAQNLQILGLLPTLPQFS